MSEFEPDAKPFCDLKELKRLTEEWRIAQLSAEMAIKVAKGAELDVAYTTHERIRLLCDCGVTCRQWTVKGVNGRYLWRR